LEAVLSIFRINNANIDQGEIKFSKEDAYHLYRVLRKRNGDTVNCQDEMGKRYSCILSDISEHKANGIIVATYQKEERKSVPVSLVFPMLKGKKTELIIQKATEIGVDQLIPFSFQRNIAKPELEKKSDRYKKIIQASCKQCERTREPVIYDFCKNHKDLETIMRGNNNSKTLCILLWEKEKRVYIKELLRGELGKPERIYLVVGPEGGITDDEVTSFKKLGFLSAGIGSNILRSETACISGLSICSYEYY